MLQKLFTKIMSIENSSSFIIDDEEATAEGIYCSLKAIFGLNAHIIHPKNSLINHSETSVRYAMEIKNFFKNDSLKLKKPIIAIWNSENNNHSSGNAYSILQQRYFWEVLVILPTACSISMVIQEYVSLLNINSSNQASSFLHELINYLNRSGEALEQSITLIPRIKVLENECKQQIYYNDSGWWAISNAIMLILHGNYEFLSYFSDKADRVLGYHLRGIYNRLKLNLTLEIHENTELLLDTRSQSIIQKQVISEKRPFNFSLKDFRDTILYSDGYIDKSLFIKEFIEEKNCAIIISRPRRWGKTLNMQMLECFFQPEIDSNGRFNMIQPNSNLKLFTGISNPSDSRKNSKGLEISRYPDLIESYQGKIPVIFITFKRIDHKSEGAIEQEFRSNIRSAYRMHDYLYKKKLIDAINIFCNPNTDDFIEIAELKIKSICTLEMIIASKIIKLSEDVLTFQKYRDGSSSGLLSDSISFLSMMLYEFYGASCYVIIDEYDAPINGSLGAPTHQFIIDTINAIFSTGLRNNKYVKKAIMTGVMNLVATSPFSGMNHFIEYSLDEPGIYSTYFGLTEVEVEKLLAENVNTYDENLKKKIKNWYNGYDIGGYVIYNPLSILNCINNYRLRSKNPIRPYWIRTGNFDLIKHIFRKLVNKDKMREIFLDSERIECNIPLVIDYNASIYDNDVLYYLLYQAGYLTRSKSCYRIPNKEIKQYFYGEILPIWIKHSFSDKLSITSFIKELVGNIEEIDLYKNAIQFKFLAFIDKSYRTEADFQALIAGLSQLAFINKDYGERHSVFCEAATMHRKRIDSLFLPIKGRSEVAIIHDYKVIQDNIDKVISVLEDGFWQVYMNNYMAKILSLSNLTQYRYFNFILVRVIVFFKDLFGCWSIEIKEFKHTLKEAAALCNIFTQDGKLIEEHQAYYTTNPHQNEKRSAFLLRHSHGSLYELLNTHTNNSDSSPKRQREASDLDIQEPEKHFKSK